MATSHRSGSSPLSVAPEALAVVPEVLAIVPEALAVVPEADPRERLSEALERMPELGGRSLAVTELPGGLTNVNYRLTAASGRQYVARVSPRQSSLLTVDREHEYRNTMAAARLGIGPAVVGYLPGDGVLVVEWIAAPTLTAADLDDSATLVRVAETCVRLHAGPPAAGDFDMFAVQRNYLDLVRDRGFRLPPDYVEFMPQVEHIRTALATGGDPPVPCHNDLLPANIMADAQRMWFIDYEYAGNNDPCFELGNLWSEAGLAPDRLAELVSAYYGRPSRRRLARARLFALLAQYGWLLWASIQDATSSVAFDFWSWGLEKYERAVAGFRGREFAQLITDVQQAR